MFFRKLNSILCEQITATCVPRSRATVILCNWASPFSMTAPCILIVQDHEQIDEHSGEHHHTNAIEIGLLVGCLYWWCLQHNVGLAGLSIERRSRIKSGRSSAMVPFRSAPRKPADWARALLSQCRRLRPSPRPAAAINNVWTERYQVGDFRKAAPYLSLAGQTNLDHACRGGL
jgi:hypothetical protein